MGTNVISISRMPMVTMLSNTITPTIMQPMATMTRNITKSTDLTNTGMPTNIIRTNTKNTRMHPTTNMIMGTNTQLTGIAMRMNIILANTITGTRLTDMEMHTIITSMKRTLTITVR